MSLKLRSIGLLLLLLLPACAPPSPRPTPPASTTAAKRSDFGRPHIDAVQGQAKVLPNAKVVHYGRVIHEGPIDINSTLDRIRAGEKLDHANDGAYFRNFEGLLPRQRDREYYREFVHRMKGLPFPGPQRVVVGKGGEVYYTGDHYASFTKVH